MTSRSLCILFVVALVLIAVAGAGCGEAAITPSSSPIWESQDARVSYVVVCDVTRSTLWQRDEYVYGLARVLDGVSYGDHLIVMSAEDASVQNSELWIEEALPNYSFTPSPRPDTDNQLLLDSWQQKQEQIFKQGSEEFVVSHDLSTWRDETLASVQGRILGRVANGSDLAGALYLAGQLLGTTTGRQERRLVLFTDGLIQTPDSNWRSGRVTLGDVKRLVKQQRSAGSLPDLKDVTVTLIGAHADDQ